MSNAILKQAFLSKTATPATRLVFLEMAFNSCSAGNVAMTIAEISESTGLNRKTIIQAAKMLVSCGFIEKTGERAGSTGQVHVYKIKGIDTGRKS